MTITETELNKVAPDLTNPYSATVDDYLTSGWSGPLPVGSKSKPYNKEPVPKDFTGWEGEWPDTDQIAKWVDQRGGYNIALRLPENVVGLDLDLYKGPAAGETMKAITEIHGMLPRTWLSTSRTDSSGIRFFSLPEGVNPRDLNGNINDPTDENLTAGEVIRYGHRYAVVWPSIHPDTGQQYGWAHQETGEARIPEPSELPLLPPEWVDHLSGECSCYAVKLTVRASKDPVADAYNKWHNKLTSGGTYSRHDAALGGTMALVAFRYQDWPQADEYLTKLEGAFLNAVLDMSDKSRSNGQAQAEWDRMVDGAETKAHTTTIPKWEPPQTTTSGHHSLDETMRLDQPFTDSDNAAYFAELEGDQIRYVHKWGTWLVWSDNHWEVDGGNALIADKAKAVARHHSQRWYEESQTMTKGEADQLASWAKQSFSRSRIEAMVYLTRGIDGVLIDHNSLDADANMLHVANGRINLTTGEHEPSDPTHLNTKMSPVHYDPTATAPTWERSLEEWHPDSAQRAYLQRLVGEAALGTVRDHLLAIHFGDGANGKGTCINALAYCFGDYFTVPHKSLLTVSRYEQHATVVASLFRARLAVASETERRIKLNEAIVKNLTGGDTLRARRMREDEWSFEPTHSLWLQTNHLPEIAGTDQGIWRRVRVVPWVESFDGDKGDVHLADKLKAEAPGILNWIIQGALDYQQHGLTEPDSVIEATDEYRKAEDKVARFLSEYGYQVGGDHHVRAAIIQGEWAEWTESVYGQKTRGHELAEGLHNRSATSQVVRVTEGGARQQVTMWQGVGKPEENHVQ